MPSLKTHLVVYGYIRLQSKPYCIPNEIIQLCLLWFAPIKIDNCQLNGYSFAMFDYLAPTKMVHHGWNDINIRVKHNQSDKKYLLKQFRHFDLKNLRLTFTEIKLLSHFNHRNVMHSLDACPLKPDEIYTFRKIHILLPNMNTTLNRVIRSEDITLTERHRQSLIYQIMRGLQYIHKCGVIHTHLEPSNILINYNDCHIRITGFKYAVPFNTTLTANVAKNLSVSYAAPELIANDFIMTEKTDIWAVGCIAAELYRRRRGPLFQEGSFKYSFQLILQYMGTPNDISWMNRSHRKWIESQPVQHGMNLNKKIPGLTETGGDFIRKLLTLDPNQRIDVETAMNHQWFKHFDEFNVKGKGEMNDCTEVRFDQIKKMEMEREVRRLIYELIHEIYLISPHKYSNAL